MVQVDFHILNSADGQRRQVYACRVVEKAWQRGHRIFVRVADDTVAATMDNLLWTFRDRSFLPHTVDGPGAAPEPILIGTGDGPERGDADIAVNLAPSAPGAPEQFTRIMEIGDQEPETLRAARERFRWYVAQGWQPQHHAVEAP